jgi:hypothetical protein
MTHVDMHATPNENKILKNIILASIISELNRVFGAVSNSLRIFYA